MATSPLTGASPTGAPGLRVPLTRARDGRWLAGVCAGLARHRTLPVRLVRIAFGVSALVGGVGVLIYLACWLIIPTDTDDGTRAAGTRGIVVLAQGCAACVGLATLAALGAAATIFGFGWVVLVIAAVVLLAALATWPRVGAGWTLLPIAALVLPSLAMAAGGVRIDPESRDVAVAPRSVAAIPHAGYNSGLGSLLVDLRHTAFPATGNITLRIDAGIRRTIVALPTKRCVLVDLKYDVVPFAARVGSFLSGRDAPFSGVTLFGVLQGSRAGEDGNVPGPTAASPILTVYFHSAGGSLYVRDYADNVDPQTEPDWPGYPVSLEPRPNTTGTPPAAAKRLIDGWLLRRRVQSASAARVNRLLPGPCGGSVGQPTPARPVGGPFGGPYPYPYAGPYPTVKPYAVGPIGKSAGSIGKAAGPIGKTAGPIGKGYFVTPAGAAGAAGAAGPAGAAGGSSPAGGIPARPTPPAPPAPPSTGGAARATSTDGASAQAKPSAGAATRAKPSDGAAPTPKPSSGAAARTTSSASAHKHAKSSGARGRTTTTTASGR